jgi:3-phosphoshikimate 1-carboxyvinyltransferase
MNQTIHPSKVSGSLIAPSSKSYAQRAIILASVAKGRSVISNVGNNDDVRAAIEVCKAFGAAVTESESSLGIVGCQTPVSNSFNCGESGFLLRAFTPVAATFNKKIVINGRGSLLNRDQGFLIESLAAFGVDCKGENGKLPLVINGPFGKLSTSIDGTHGSQVLSGLLMAAPLTKQPVNLLVNDLKSKRYVDLTIDVMSLFGVTVKNTNHEHFFVEGNQEYTACNINVEGDWSGAAFLLVAGAVAGKVELTNLNIDSHQPDKEIVDVLQIVGANVEIFEKSISVSKNHLKPFTFDATNCPDLFPPLVALAANCKGVSKIKGVGRLANKESDRAKALIDIFDKMGVEIEVFGDEMIVKGGGEIRGCKVHSHNDHRIAMAAAIAALNATGPIIINGSEAVAKSYPHFYEHLRVLAGEHRA